MARPHDDGRTVAHLGPQVEARLAHARQRGDLVVLGRQLEALAELDDAPACRRGRRPSRAAAGARAMKATWSAVPLSRHRRGAAA